ncbi:MAG: multiple sugar transport system permease protein [Gaiellales bacterium]|jgi:multiple sugar transport system permease protein|nr:multiple sugar transport system permease protein [Gaiellales bacterium]
MTDARILARRRRRLAGLRSVLSHALLVVVALLFAAPLIFAFATSLKPQDEVFTAPPTLVGSELRWENYVEAFQFAPFARYFFNSFLVAIIGTAVVLAASSLSAFAFARLRFPGRELLFVLFLGTLMVPQEVLIVPMYWLMQTLGWVDSYQALILPFAFTAFGTFLLRQFFLTVPAELVDSARVDGAGLFNIFLRIMLPLARPALAVLAMFTFIAYWGSFLWPLIVIDTINVKGTVPLGLNSFMGQQGTQWHLMMAAAMLAMLPSALLVVLLQKNLSRGLLTTGFGGR